MKYTINQEAAIKTFGKNIIVSAGAGSGKTGVLQARVIEKLRLGVHIDDLIILTFTNAAAFEMRSRIIDSIKENPIYAEELKRINRSVISTFDAFCLKLVKQYHYLLDLPSKITIGDQILIKKMEQVLLEQVIKEYYLKNDPDFNDLVISHFQRGDALIIDAISMLSNRLLKEPKRMRTQEEFEQIYFNQEKLEEQFNNFEVYLNEIVTEIYDYFQALQNSLLSYDNESIIAFVNHLEKEVNKVLHSKNYDELVIALASLNLPRKINTSKDEYLKEVLTDFYDPLRSALKTISGTVASLFASTKNEAIDNVLKTKRTVLKLYEITAHYLELLEKAKRENNLFGYNDIMEMAISLLEDNQVITDDYRNSINEIMIDEYQDTNDLQEYFISLLANNNLFMVGDIKQSIYGFRDANPKNFHDRYIDYKSNKSGVAIDLRENFRSRQQVLDDINRCFAPTMNESIGGIDYQDSQSLKYGLKKYDLEIKDQDYGIQLLTYNYKELKADNPNKDKMVFEAEIVASDIRNRIDTHYKILNIKSGEFKEILYQDIAILIDRKTDFETISMIFSKENIPVNLYSDEPFVKSPEMLFLTNYLKFIKCYRDNDYLKQNFKSLLYGVARSFVYQISDEDIISLIETHEMVSLIQVESCLTNVFAKLHDDAKYLAKMIDNSTNYDIIQELYSRLDIFAKVALLTNPSKKSDKLDYFAMNIGNISGFSYDDLIEYLELIDKNEEWDIEYSPNQTNINAVKLMTMHKSKGLQFPIVYVMGSSKQFNFSENKDFFIFDKRMGLISNVIESGYYPTFQRILYLQEAKRNYISERIRLFYVTLTRAQENLFLVFNNDDYKPELSAIDDATGYVYDRIRLSFRKYSDLLSCMGITNMPIVKPATHALPKVSHDSYRSTDKVIEHKSFDLFTREIDTTKYSKKSTDLIDDETIEALGFGNYIHGLLENFDYYDLTNSLTKLPNNIKSNIEKLIKSDILSLKLQPEIFQEAEFYFEDQNGTHHGIIDLMSVTQDKAVIVDFKLKNLDDEAYLNQLSGYKDYVEKTLKKPVDCYLFAVLTGELRKIY